ncbi:MAG TPA: hypothetical protein VK464_28110 [Symbiobacteriaceae bacterium]|jgi:hypothetical protein|nr:hypothetical protein [Symbiobacteriaceae bacterium]
MTAMLRETTTHWTQTFRTGDFWGRLFILWMLVVAPALVVGATLSYVVR